MRPMSGRGSHSWLTGFLRPLAPAFAEVVVVSLFVNLLALAVPVFVLQVYDRVVFHAGLNTLAALVAAMVLVMVFDFILRQMRARVLQTVALKLDALIGRLLMEKIGTLPLIVLERQPAPYWQALFRDVEQVRNALSGGSAVLICDLPFVVLFLTLTFLIAQPVAWVILAVLPVFVFIAWGSGASMTRGTAKERDSAAARDSLVAEMIAGRSTVKALALEGALVPTWEERHARAIGHALDRGAHADGYANLAAAVTMATTVAMTTFGALAILEQRLTIGALIAANMLSGRLIGPLNQLVTNWRTYAAFAQAARRLGHAFALPGERTESVLQLGRPRGRITIENASFAYPGAAHPMLRGISLDLPATGLHGLMGPNGSGKSTFLKLIQGLYGCDAGRVLIDGADISQYTRREIAGWLGVVPQECVLFAGSIRTNIALHQPDAEDAAIVQAAEAAGIHADIIDLPDGYATDIGEAGRRLSAGQRQRLVIARALLGRPAVLLLDEPSSNLDHQAEKALRRTLIDLAREATVVVATHSLVLLSACDTVSVLERGTLTATGPGAAILRRLIEVRPAAEARPSRA
ncbi:MAG TPA: ATP-binding cassette domain-containing protein [Defluviicoccus sp.]|nr:ATP-binding cassette domain-containing protein [Defluviicoccus sp.]